MRRTAQTRRSYPRRASRRIADKGARRQRTARSNKKKYRRQSDFPSPIHPKAKDGKQEKETTSRPQSMVKTTQPERPQRPMSRQTKSSTQSSRTARRMRSNRREQEREQHGRATSAHGQRRAIRESMPHHPHWQMPSIKKTHPYPKQSRKW